MSDYIFLRYQNHVYVYVFKNASSTYNSFLMQMGWKTITSRVVFRLKHKFKLFGHIQDPNTRHTKGIIEYMYANNLDQTEDWESLLKVVPEDDDLIVPISTVYRELIDLIHWIPLDLEIKKQKISSNDLTNMYFRDNDLPFVIDDRFFPHNQSDQQKKHLQQSLHAYKIAHGFYQSYARYAQDEATWIGSKSYYTDYLKTHNLLEKH